MLGNTGARVFAIATPPTGLQPANPERRARLAFDHFRNGRLREARKRGDGSVCC
jgi:hypothetical protein